MLRSNILKAAILSLAVSSASLFQSLSEPRAEPPSPIDSSRILSIGGDVTEIIHALGAYDRIVAVDLTSQFPADALKTKKVVGYMRALSSEGVLAVNPSVVIATEGAGPPEVVSALKASSLRYVTVPDDSTEAGITRKIQIIAKTLGTGQQGDRLAHEVAAAFLDLKAKRELIKKPVRALFVFSAQGGRAMVGGSGTSADAVLKLAGAQNAAGTIHGFKPVVDEALLDLAPDVIVMMRRGDGQDSHDQLLQLPGLKQTPAGRNGRIIIMDGLYLLGFGPRAPQAARDLMAEIYPNLNPATQSVGQ